MSPSDPGIHSPKIKKGGAALPSNQGDFSKVKTMEMDMRLIEDLEDKIIGLQEVLETKLDMSAIESMLSDKVSKNELMELLPD